MLSFQIYMINLINFTQDFKWKLIISSSLTGVAPQQNQPTAKTWWLKGWLMVVVLDISGLGIHQIKVWCGGRWGGVAAAACLGCITLV